MTDELKAWMLTPGQGQLKALTASQWLRGVQEARASTQTPQGVYASVSWVYRATRLRANALSRLPWELVREGGEPLDEPPFELDMQDIFWRTEAVRCLFGAAFWVKLNNGVLLKGLQYLNPTTMTFKRNRTTNALEGYRQEEFRKEWPLDEMVYIPLWNPDDDVTPGPAPAQVALVEAGLAMHANEFAAGFFEHGALPSILLTSKGPLVKGAAERIKETFRKAFSVKRQPWETGVLEAGMDVKQLTPPIRDLMVPELMAEVRQQIANAFEIPVTWLADSANYATAQNDTETFWTATMIPEAEMIAGAMNAQLWKPMGLELRFQWKEIEAIQAQEARKAESTSRLMAVAVSQFEAKLNGRDRTRFIIDAYWEQMGLDLTDAPDDEPEEPEPMPDMTPKEGDADVLPDTLPNVPATRAIELAEDDLLKWRRKVKNRGKACDFESEWIPEDLAYSIKMALDAAETEDDLLEAFEPPFV